MDTARWFNTPYKFTIGVRAKLNGILYSANRKSANTCVRLGCTCSPNGFIIDLMFIFDTDVSHIDAILKRGRHLATNTNAYKKQY
jgi:hypothetical protein